MKGVIKVDSNVKKEIGNRLRKLRKGKGYSQTELSKEIEKKKDIVILEENEAGKNAISQLEKGKRGLTIDNALIYADIFNVSLDYIYRGTEDWKPEYKVIKEQLGLSDESINKLESMKKNKAYLISTLDYLLNPEKGTSFIELLQALQEHSSIKSQANMDKFKMYLSNSGIVKYEKNENPRITEKEAEYVSLFKISEIIRKIANEIKNKLIK